MQNEREITPSVKQPEEKAVVCVRGGWDRGGRCKTHGFMGVSSSISQARNEETGVRICTQQSEKFYLWLQEVYSLCI